jgi:drug/metabolite transporter (DMT)-like permease
LSSLVYGTADYFGGTATRSASAWSVTASSQLVGLLAAFACLPFMWGDGPSVRAFGFGILGGLAGAVGLMLLYHALAHGTMSIVSPVTAVMAAVVPFLFGVTVLGQRPGAAPLIGIVCALTAIVLVSASGASGRDRHVLRTIRWAIGSGIGFGTFFIFLDRIGGHPGVWPLLGARPASILLASVVARRARQPILVPRGTWRWAAPAGAMDMTANLLFVLATSHGPLAITAVLASLYPVSTVALARVVDGERLQPIQDVGLLFALASVVLIAAN